MTRRPGDRDDDPLLRDLFATLRREDQRAVPGFDRLLAEARGNARQAGRAHRGGWWLWAGAGAVAAVVVAVVLARVPPPAPRPQSLDEALAMARAMDTWEAPTDSILEIALLKMPDTVPTLEYTSVPLPAVTTPSRRTP